MVFIEQHLDGNYCVEVSGLQRRRVRGTGADRAAKSARRVGFAGTRPNFIDGMISMARSPPQRLGPGMFFPETAFNGSRRYEADDKHIAGKPNN